MTVATDQHQVIAELRQFLKTLGALQKQFEG
jgi:hypothetical protein